MYNLLHGIVASARTNRYDCVSLAPPPFFFYLYIYIYIYISYTCSLSISRSPLLRSSFSKVPSLFFHPYPSYVLVIEAIFQLVGLTEAISSPLGRERESFRETVYRITEALCERDENRENGAGRCDGIDGRVAPTSRAVKLNAYLRGSNEN